MVYGASRRFRRTLFIDNSRTTMITVVVSDDNYTTYGHKTVCDFRDYCHNLSNTTQLRNRKHYTIPE